MESWGNLLEFCAILGGTLGNPFRMRMESEGVSMKLWGEAAEGRPSLLKSFQNIHGILKESLGTCAISGGTLGNPFRMRVECEGISMKLWGEAAEGRVCRNPSRIFMES